MKLLFRLSCYSFPPPRSSPLPNHRSIRSPSRPAPLAVSRALSPPSRALIGPLSPDATPPSFLAPPPRASPSLGTPPRPSRTPRRLPQRPARGTAMGRLVLQDGSVLRGRAFGATGAAASGEVGECRGAGGGKAAGRAGIPRSAFFSPQCSRRASWGTPRRSPTRRTRRRSWCSPTRWWATTACPGSGGDPSAWAR